MECERLLALAACLSTGLILINCGGSSRSTSAQPATSPPPAISVTISPTSAGVQVGLTQQFTATVTNTSNVAVHWLVNDVAGGGATIGTISSNGLFTAPVAVPNPAAVTIAAVSQADPTKSASASTTIALPHIGHVFVLVEENHGYASVIGSAAMPYLNSLANGYGLATNYFADAHPSIGNYFMLTTGQIITNDDSYTATVAADNLVRELIAAGKTWKSYAESLPSVGYIGGDRHPYLEHHNPFSFFSDVRNNNTQAASLVPFPQLPTDLAADQLPNFGFILPNAEHDGHDCPGGGSNCTEEQKLATADSWLQANVATLIASPTFQRDGLLVIVFDESGLSDTEHGGGHVAALVISPKAKSAFQSSTLYQHESVLRMLVEITGAAALPGASATAPDMGEFFP